MRPITIDERLAGRHVHDVMLHFTFQSVVAAVVALGLLFAPLNAYAQAGTSKIAVIDTERAVSQTEDGARAQATLKQLLDSRQAELAAGRHEAVWDGRDAEGRMAAAGAYFLRVRAGDKVVSAKVTRLR